MGPTLSNGTRLSVSTAPPLSPDRAGYEALSFTQIRGARTVGDIGKTWRTVDRAVMGSSRADTVRDGVHSGGTVQVELYRVPDAGQDILRSAVEAGSYSYRLVQPDGLTLFFTAEAISRLHGGFTPGSFADTKMVLAIDSDIIEV